MPELIHNNLTKKTAKLAAQNPYYSAAITCITTLMIVFIAKIFV